MSIQKRVTVKEIKSWLKTLEEFRYRKVPKVDSRRISSFVNNGLSETDLPQSLQKKWEYAKYGKEKHLANKFMKERLNQSEIITVNGKEYTPITETINESKSVKSMIKRRVVKKGQSEKDRVKNIKIWLNKYANKDLPGVYPSPYVHRLQIPGNSMAQDWWMDILNDISSELRESKHQFEKTYKKIGGK